MSKRPEQIKIRYISHYQGSSRAELAREFDKAYKQVDIKEKEYMVRLAGLRPEADYKNDEGKDNLIVILPKIKSRHILEEYLKQVRADMVKRQISEEFVERMFDTTETSIFFMENGLIQIEALFDSEKEPTRWDDKGRDDETVLEWESNEVVGNKLYDLPDGYHFLTYRKEAKLPKEATLFDVVSVIKRDIETPRAYKTEKEIWEYLSLHVIRASIVDGDNMYICWRHHEKPTEISSYE